MTSNIEKCMIIFGMGIFVEFFMKLLFFFRIFSSMQRSTIDCDFLKGYHRLR